jgi:hypothetical protein
VDQHRFDTMTRSLSSVPSRRTLLRGLAGLSLALGAARLPGAATAKKKHKQHKKKQTKQNKQQHERDAANTDQARLAAAGGPCGPCQKKQKGQCVPKPDGTPCGGGQICQAGVCQAPPAPTCETTCAGCCSDGQCYPGDTNQTCGQDGALCVSCAGDEACTAEGVCGPPSTCGIGGPCLVFVTSVASQGNLGGLAGADATCQSLAAASGLFGTYRAWLSDGTASPATRFVHSPGPYQLVDGTTITANWADLTDGAIQAPIVITEQGTVVSSPEVWTNTRADGTVNSDTRHCHDWTTVDSGAGQTGYVWANNVADWTDTQPVSACSESHHLYCFQQS